MITQFVTLEVPLQADLADTQRSILVQLQTYGEPLRWAITAIEVDRQMAHIEAVVLAPTEFPVPFHSIKTV